MHDLHRCRCRLGKRRRCVLSRGHLGPHRSDAYRGWMAVWGLDNLVKMLVWAGVK